jgi:hypothetical protein
MSSLFKRFFFEYWFESQKLSSTNLMVDTDQFNSLVNYFADVGVVESIEMVL